MFGLDVDEIGPSLRFATAKVNKTIRASNGTTAPDDPWTSASSTPAGVGASDEPPF